MKKRIMMSNVEGRVRKIKTSDPFLSLYEAISNSIHAIDEADQTSGAITVVLQRNSKQTELAINTDPPVTGFEITDNGIGFDDDNITSFWEADSSHKRSVGGKGIGRFTWLKFFSCANISSVFRDGASFKRRTFVFSEAKSEGEKVEACEGPAQTCVTLSPLKAVEYEARMRKNSAEVAAGIVEHFLAYFVTGAMPQLTLVDQGNRTDLSTFYRTLIGNDEQKEEFEIRGTIFEATCVRFYPGNASHTGFLCADKRAADRIVLSKRDKFLALRFPDEHQKKFALHVFVQSTYLDDIVHDDRDGFRFPDPESLDSHEPGAVTKDEIAAKVVMIARDFLRDDIARLREKNFENVSKFVAEQAPQYLQVLANNRSLAEEIHETTPVEIDQHLRRLQFKNELDTRSEIQKLLRSVDDSNDVNAQWLRRSQQLLEKLSDQGKATLADYVLKRKLILDLLETRLQRADGEYAKEEAVHRLIFPMRTESSDVDYADQNLWIVDERLSYHYYLASDKPLSKMPTTGTTSNKEPDIIVFNRPIALDDGEENRTLESVVIIEFKRPGEKVGSKVGTPVTQIQEYIELIREGSAKTRKGQRLQVSQGTKFFGYVVCDLDPELKTLLKRANMKEMPDGRGMFGFFEDHRAYIEVMSYEKLVDDAKKRNRVLFEKLGIPTVRDASS